MGAYLALIFFLSTRPHLQAPVRFPFWDKGAHFIEYGLLGFITLGALRRSRPEWRALGWPRLLLLWAGGLCVALFDEWLQGRIPGRESSAADLAADGLGFLAGLWLERRLSTRRAGRGPFGPVRSARGERRGAGDERRPS
ncbi:MAG: VanZ family protein [Candidatus Eisenbacteria bacterium]|uniref:VanZ family protein n=1 Tax=Eiseniibacteriota bacterium TaxID=2212470 RepID=A0A938BR61_UNCEI|nr:VanZ family protein [Candidatus Eisenbacteria bacterium]